MQVQMDYLQPFFDPRYVDIYCEQFYHIVIGCSPDNPASATYWQTVNKAFFPEGLIFRLKLIVGNKIFLRLPKIINNICILCLSNRYKTYLEGIFANKVLS